MVACLAESSQSAIILPTIFDFPACLHRHSVNFPRWKTVLVRSLHRTMHYLPAPSRLSTSAGLTSTPQTARSTSSNLLPQPCKRYIITIPIGSLSSKFSIAEYPRLSIRTLSPQNNIDRIPSPPASTGGDVIIAVVGIGISLRDHHDIPREWNAEIWVASNEVDLRAVLEELSRRVAQVDRAGAVEGVEARKRKEMENNADELRNDGRGWRSQPSRPKPPSTSYSDHSDAKRLKPPQTVLRSSCSRSFC